MTRQAASTASNQPGIRDALGIAVGQGIGGATRSFLWVSLTGCAIDILVFEMLFGLGIRLPVALSASFAVASVFSYVLLWRQMAGSEGSAEGAGTAGRLFRIITICLLGFGLRGGVVADAMALLAWSPAAGIVLGAGAAAVTTHLGNRFFVFQAAWPRATATRWQLAALGVVAYMLALRLAFIGLVDLLPEEAYYWNFSQHIDIGYLDHPPMSSWMIWLGTGLFGNTEFGVRIGAYLCSIVLCVFVYRLTAHLFDRAAAVVALVLASVLPVFFYTGFLMTPDVPLTTAWAGALYFLERALVADRRNAWWGVGICAGLGMLSKYTIALLGPAALIFVLVDPRARRWLARPQPYIAAATALVLFSPVIYWNATHGWASFAFQSTQRLADTPEFSTPTLVASAALLLTPLGLVAAVAALASNLRQLASNTAGDPQARRRRLFMLVFTLTPLSVFAAFSLSHEVKLNWTGPVWLAILPAIAAAILAATTKTAGIAAALRKCWAPTLLATLSVYAMFLHYLVLGLPFAGHLGNIRTLPVAWDDFGREVGRIASTVEQQTGQSVLIAGMDKYFVASEVAFYARRDGRVMGNSVGGGPLGDDSLMYGYWYKPSDMNDQTIILVGLKKSDVDKAGAAQHFDRLTDMATQDVSRDGQTIGRFFYRIGYRYRDCVSPQAACATP